MPARLTLPPRSPYDQLLARVLRPILAAPGIRADVIARESGYTGTALDVAVTELREGGWIEILPGGSTDQDRLYPSVRIPPTLTDGELDFVAAVRRDLSPGEIAAWLGCEIGQIYRAFHWMRGTNNRVT